jgi:hypothetical protein
MQGSAVASRSLQLQAFGYLAKDRAMRSAISSTNARRVCIIVCAPVLRCGTARGDRRRRLEGAELLVLGGVLHALLTTPTVLMVVQVGGIRLCMEAGCSKESKRSATMGRMYCFAHMRQHGLEPRVRKCQQHDCTKAAQSAKGSRIRTYCVQHMRMLDLQPNKKLCQQALCTKQAQSQTGGGPQMFCKQHMREHHQKALYAGSKMNSPA